MAQEDNNSVRSADEIIETITTNDTTAISEEQESELLDYIESLNKMEEEKEEIVETKSENQEKDQEEKDKLQECYSQICEKSSYEKKEELQEEIEDKENKEDLEENQEETNYLLSSMMNSVEKLKEWDKNREPSFITKSYEKAKDAGSGMIEKIKEDDFVQSLIKGAIVVFIVGLYKWYQEAKKHEGGVIGWIAEKVGDLMKKAWEKIKNIDYGAIWEKIKTFFTNENFISKFFDDTIVPYFTSGKFWEHVKATGAFLARIGEMIAPALDQWYTALFGKYWTDYVKPFFQNSFLALVDWWGTVEAAGGIWNWLKYSVWKMFEGLKIGPWNIGEKLKTANISRIESSIEAFKSKKDENEKTTETFSNTSTSNTIVTNDSKTTKNIQETNNSQVLSNYLKSNTSNTNINTESKNISFIKPVQSGTVINNKFIKNKAFHSGITIKGQDGEAVKAVADGEVIHIGYNKLYGNFTVIKHKNGYTSFYAHQKNTSNTKIGDIVKKGDTIGFIGITGDTSVPSLFFKMSKNSKNIDVKTKINFSEENSNNNKNSTTNKSVNTVNTTTNTISSKFNSSVKKSFDENVNSMNVNNAGNAAITNAAYTQIESNSSNNTNIKNNYMVNNNMEIVKNNMNIKSNNINNINSVSNNDEKIKRLEQVQYFLSKKIEDVDKTTVTEGFLGTVEDF